MNETQTTLKCSGQRRNGGAFTMGKPVWKDCESAPIVMLTVKQRGDKTELAGCNHCWEECKTSGIEILNVRPLTDKELATEDAETKCKRCGSGLEDGLCEDITCPFSDCDQDNTMGWVGHPDTEEK
jgi:ferredoxin